MPPKKATTEDSNGDASGTGLVALKNATEAELRFLDALLSNLTGPACADWDAVAAAAGIKTVKNTKERFRLMKIKYGWLEKAPTGKSVVAGSSKVTKQRKAGGGTGGKAKGKGKKPDDELVKQEDEDGEHDVDDEEEEGVAV